MTGIPIEEQELAHEVLVLLHRQVSQPKHMLWVLKRTISMTCVLGAQNDMSFGCSKEPSR